MLINRWRWRFRIIYFHKFYFDSFIELCLTCSELSLPVCFSIPVGVHWTFPRVLRVRTVKSWRFLFSPFSLHLSFVREPQVSVDLRACRALRELLGTRVVLESLAYLVQEWVITIAEGAALTPTECICGKGGIIHSANDTMLVSCIFTSVLPFQLTLASHNGAISGYPWSYLNIILISCWYKLKHSLRSFTYMSLELCIMFSWQILVFIQEK